MATIAPADLAQYYAGTGQALPSVASRASDYSTYGLGTGYTGTAAQNQALLGKLTSSGGTSSTGPATGSNSANAGYSSATPTGDPTLTGDINNLNSLNSQETSLANTQASALQAYTQQQQGTIAGAYQAAEGQTGLQSDIDSMNKIQDALTGAQNGQAAVVPQTVADSRGSMANNDQVTAQEGTSNIPYAEQVAQLSANLVPAENAYSTAAQQTQNIAGNIVSGAQLAEQGFTAGQQEQLAALQSKVSQGEALTNDEYQTFSALQSAQIGAAASVSAASIGANASTANTNSTNAINKQIAELENPGIGLNSSGVGVANLGEALGATSPAPAPSSATTAALNSALSKYGL